MIVFNDMLKYKVNKIIEILSIDSQWYYYYFLIQIYLLKYFELVK